MKTKIEDIDRLIKDTLTEEEAKFYDDLEEQGLIDTLGGLLKGKFKWILIMMNLVSIVAAGVLVYCIVQFFQTDNTNELIKWASAGFICLMLGCMIKIFTWLQMDRNALQRELKRLELQMSSLSGRMSK